jgi:hypothetical protein
LITRLKNAFGLVVIQRHNQYAWKLVVITVVLFALLTGCIPAGYQADNQADYEPFIAPSLVPTQPPTRTPLPSSTGVPITGSTLAPGDSQEVVSESGCIDNLSFISDLTIPDGVRVVAGSTLDKQWEIENSGTCDWDERYHVRLLSGPELNAEMQQSLTPALAGSRVTLRMVFTAPEEPGSYRSAWQAFNPEGSAFGDPIFIDFEVE